MIMKRYLILLTTALVFFAACKREKKPEPVTPETPAPSTSGTVKLYLVPKLNGAPFDFYTDYTNPLNQRLQLEVLRFFLTDFYAYTATGDSVRILDAFKFDWSTHLSSISFSASPGTFTGMSVGIGVDSALNHADPTLYDPKHPLSYTMANTMHWSWAGGYIFMKLEGKSDQSGTGTGPLVHLFAFHTGNDKCYRRTPVMAKNFSITAGETTNLYLDFDVAKFFVQPTDTIDLSVDSVTHASGPTDLPLANRVASNMAKSFWFE
jgi:hypothetical protein